ncbi:MAG TPA: thiolase family protein [Acidobacteriota bacterium]|nr:thiolase family protein [Acidobacteriota bacterium]
MKPTYLAGAVRTPIGKFGGALADWTAAELGVAATQEALRRAGLTPETVQEVIFGSARQAGGGPNVARQIGYRSGIPETVPAYTVNQACASGLKSILLAIQEIQLGQADVVVAGGTESMSRVPYFAEGARWGARLGHTQLVDGMYRDGFLCPLSGKIMGETAETLAVQYGISRREQDEFALRSHQRAEAAETAGYFAAERMTLSRTDSRGRTQTLDRDEHPRAGMKIEDLAKLPPVFSKTGTVAAGNSSGITDGAAAVVVLSEEAVTTHHISPLARVVGYATVGLDPNVMGLGPVPATKKLLDRQQLSLDDIDLIELNEAFAAQVIACDRELGLDPERLNVNGGAIALGHPIGCTGTRIVVTLLHEMKRRQMRRGLATLCVSGGLGIALLLENV